MPVVYLGYALRQYPIAAIDFNLMTGEIDPVHEQPQVLFPEFASPVVQPENAWRH